WAGMRPIPVLRIAALIPALLLGGLPARCCCASDRGAVASHCFCRGNETPANQRPTNVAPARCPHCQTANTSTAAGKNSPARSRSPLPGRCCCATRADLDVPKHVGPTPVTAPTAFVATPASLSQAVILTGSATQRACAVERLMSRHDDSVISQCRL